MSVIHTEQYKGHRINIYNEGSFPTPNINNNEYSFDIVGLGSGGFYPLMIAIELSKEIIEDHLKKEKEEKSMVTV